MTPFSCPYVFTQKAVHAYLISSLEFVVQVCSVNLKWVSQPPFKDVENADAEMLPISTADVGCVKWSVYSESRVGGKFCLSSGFKVKGAFFLKKW